MDRRRTSATAASASRLLPLLGDRRRLVHGSGRLPPSRRWAAMIMPRMPTSKVVEYFEASAKPIESPVAIRSQPDGDRVYSQRRYRVETVKRAAPISVVIREEWATKFGSKAANAIPSTAAASPQRRYAHHPMSPTKTVPRNRVGSRPRVRSQSAGSEEL